MKRTSNRPILLALALLTILTVSGSASASALEDIPSALGDELGVSDDVAKIILALSIILALALMLAAAKAPVEAYPMVVLPFIGLFTVIGWLPLFIILLLVVLVSLLFADKIRDAIQGG